MIFFPTERRRPFLLLMLAIIAAHAGLDQKLAGQTAPSSVMHAIHEQSYVRIGGIDQWITINGDDRNNPVVLNLHGGPGAVATPFADAMFAGWQREFTLVQWDQRGAGRTYAKTGPSVAATMTMDRMVQDGIELAEYLRDHLHKNKLVLTGGSWGAVLGAQMAHARPDLFVAYVGVAQIVGSEDWAAGYARTLALARVAVNSQAISDLQSIGPPPWDQLRKFGTWSRWTRVFESKDDPPLDVKPSADYASEAEQHQAMEGEALSQEHLFGLDMHGPLATINLLALGTTFQLPVFIIQGEADLKAVPEVTREYFDQIQAPAKQYFVVPKAGHEPTAALMDRWRRVLVEQVRPLALAR